MDKTSETDKIDTTGWTLDDWMQHYGDAKTMPVTERRTVYYSGDRSIKKMEVELRGAFWFRPDSCVVARDVRGGHDKSTLFNSHDEAVQFQLDRIDREIATLQEERAEWEALLVAGD